MFGSKPFGDELDENAWNQLIFGAEGEDGGAGDADGDSGDGDYADGDESGADGGAEEEEKDPKDQRISELSTEAKNRRLALRASEAENKKLLAELDALRNKNSDGNVDEATKSKIEGPLIERIERMAAASRATAIRNAILAEGQAEGAGRRVWHSADNVLSQIDFDAIDYDAESGTIEGVSDELNRIAGEQPFLIKEKGKPAKKPADKDGDKTGKAGASGNQPGGAGRQVHGMDEKRKKDLGARFPVLNRR